MFLDEEVKCRFKDVMIFATGADEEPPLGFVPLPTLRFENAKYPTANTCSNILNIPLQHQTYEEFRDAMEFGIMNCAGFGLP